MTPNCPVIDTSNFTTDLDYLAGVAMLIDKPKDWTSFDVVAKLRNTIGKYLSVRKLKVGHAGTLDPLATGLLIVCVGKATKQIEGFQGLFKEYDARIKLGASTNTYDAEGEETDIKDASHIMMEDLELAVERFRGLISQKPPIYSAIKVKGKALYKYARRGETVEIKSREVTIHEYELLQFENPIIDARINCSKGTYIRSLAHDLGQTLGVGGYLADLRRTAIGQYSVANALSLPDIIQAFSDES